MLLYWRHLPARILHNDFGSEEEMDTKGSGLSVVPLVKIVKVVSGVVTMGSMLGSTMGSAVFFSSVPNCKFETGLKLFERYIIIRGFTKFGIKVSRRLQFLEYLRTLH